MVTLTDVVDVKIFIGSENNRIMKMELLEVTRNVEDRVKEDMQRSAVTEEDGAKVKWTKVK